MLLNVNLRGQLSCCVMLNNLVLQNLYQIGFWECSLEYALFSKSEKFQCGYPWPFRNDHKKLLGKISFNVALDPGPHGPFEKSVLILPPYCVVRENGRS